MVELSNEAKHLLAGRHGIVTGIANSDSIAYGCAKAFRALGADIAVTYVNEKARPHVQPLAESLGADLFLPLDVTDEKQMQSRCKACSITSGKSGAGLISCCTPSHLRQRKTFKAGCWTAR
jgi:enoyl-[acyl-carrier protein] reductase I